MGISLKRLKAFTLIELLIVIGIIGILAVAFLPRITGAPAKARDAQRKANLQAISQAVEAYAADHGGLFPGITGGGAGNECLVAGTAGTDPVAVGLVGYMRGGIPSDPSGTSHTNGTCTTAGVYQYFVTVGEDSYVVVATIESSTDPQGPAYCIGDSAALAGADPVAGGDPGCDNL